MTLQPAVVGAGLFSFSSSTWAGSTPADRPRSSERSLVPKADPLGAT